MSGCVGCGSSAMTGNVRTGTTANGRGTPSRICTGRTCAGRCTGPCPSGYICQKNSYGLFRCIKKEPQVWEQWWFWVILAMAVIIVIGLIYVIYTKMKEPKQPAKTANITIQPPGQLTVNQPAVTTLAPPPPMWQR